MSDITDQPPPNHNANPSVWDLVIKDLKDRTNEEKTWDSVRVKSINLVISDAQDRNSVGIARYGTPLQAFNGRNAAVDAYQEFLDGTVYLRQLMEELREKKDEDSKMRFLFTEILYHKNLDSLVIFRRYIL